MKTSAKVWNLLSACWNFSAKYAHLNVIDYSYCVIEGSGVMSAGKHCSPLGKMAKIKNYLYLGGLAAAKMEDLLKENGITCVISGRNGPIRIYSSLIPDLFHEGIAPCAGYGPQLNWSCTCLLISCLLLSIILSCTGIAWIGVWIDNLHKDKARR